MSVLVMYVSKGGNTKMLGEAVCEGVKSIDGVTCVFKEAKDVTREDFIECDALIAGSPVYFGTMSYELKEVFDRLIGTRRRMEDKIGAAFATSRDPSGGKETTMFSIIQAMMIYGMIIVGDPMSATGHYGVACVDAPDETARQNAIKLGKRVALLAKKVKRDS